MNLKSMIVIVFLFILWIASIWAFVYHCFFRQKAITGDFYCLTNQRAFKYDSKKDRLVFGYLINYVNMECFFSEGDYGNLRMSGGMDFNQNEMDFQEVLKLKELMLHPDPQNMPGIEFQSIKNPEEVLEIAKNARNELLKEN